MKILHVNMSLDPVSGGGTVERTLQLHKALLALGVKSHILTINRPDKAGATAAVCKDITPLPCINKRWFIPSPQISTVKSLIKEADVIHIMNHWTLINAWVYLVARKLGKPYVICPAGALTIFGRSTIKKHFYQWIVGKSILRNASAAIVVSPHETGLLKKSGVALNSVYHIPNGVDEDDFSYSDDKLFRKVSGIGSVPYILFVGRLNKIKGPDLLLQAFAKLTDEILCHLVFAGPDGGMVEQLQQLAIDLNVSNRVDFTGYLGGELKSSAYHGAELLAVPSRHEAMSIVALEGSVCKTPVLLTDQCGFSSLQTEGAAVEVPATIMGLSNGLRKMLVDKCDLDEMGKSGRKFALNNYTWSIVAKRFLDLAVSIK